MTDTLIVSEVFSSMQGEGQTMGKPAVFLRLGGCNLLCKGEWTCDTIAVWQKSRRILFEYVLTQEQIRQIRSGWHLIITGGEPLLHQEAIASFLYWFRVEHGVYPIVEIETNGTIAPEEHLLPLIRYWNVSPKLSNSGETFERRVNDVAIKKLMRSVARDRIIFKFVINKDSDYIDITEDYPFIPEQLIVLMPAGENQEQLAVTRPMVAKLCAELGVRYCDRLHIVIWNQKTGV